MSQLTSKPRQFRLITLIGVVTLAAVLVRLSLAFPSQVITAIVFAVTATGILWLVSVVSDAISALGRFAIQAIKMQPSLGKDRATSPWHIRFWIALRYGDPTLPYLVPPAPIVALATVTMTLVAWRPIRFVGQFFSGLPTFYGTESFSSYVFDSWSWSEWTDPLGWKFNLIWEAASQSHWWLHFAILGIIGTSLVAICGGAWKVTERLRRFLLFAPWLMLLDLMLLFASWMLQPTTVPEPSTGFVVGIFRWDLWHWDCWLDSFWLLRASLPCALVAAVFFHRVFDANWIVSLACGMLSIPLAISGCIATSVFFNDLLTRFGW
jgi:hypothetical protein